MFSIKVLWPNFTSPTHMETPPEITPEEPQIIYATVKERVQAVAFDAGIIFAGAVMLFSGLDELGMENSELKQPLFITLFVLYDPLMISLTGGTIGHKMVNLTVRKATNHFKKINPLLAFVRFAVKGLLGWMSLLTITGNPEKRAIHDFLSDSVVLKSK